MDLEPGGAFGPFHIVRWMARGAMGVIYLATDAQGREIALKVMVPEIAADADAAARFLREAAAVSRLQHRNIVAVHDSGVVDGIPYMVMELLAGTTLAAAMPTATLLSLDRRLDMVIQLCEALQFAHDHGVVHRDVKPANIWLLENGSVKLLDFGMARVAGSSLTKVGDVVGSAAYMSPEQVTGGELDGRADIFAAGAVLYELLTGQRAFSGTNVAGVMHKILHSAPLPIRSIAPDVSPEIEAVVLKALEKRPDDRFVEAADFETELRLLRYRIATESAPAASPPDETMVAPKRAAETLVVPRRPSPEPAAGAPLSVSPAALAKVPPTPAQPKTAPPAIPSSGPAVAGTPAVASRSRGPVTPKQPLGGSVTTAASAAVSLSARAISDRCRRYVAALLDRVVVLRRTGDFRRLAVAGAATVAVIALVGVASWAWKQTSGPGSYQLVIRSMPPDASIAVDGVDTGRRTPATVTLEAPPERLRLTLPGFTPLDVRMTERFDAGPVTLDYTLGRRLRLASTPPGAEVTIDGRRTGLITPSVADLPPDASVVEMRLGELYGRGRVAQDIGQSGELSLVLARSSRAPGTPPVKPPDVPPVVAVPRVPASVTITGNYPYEVTGCGGVSSPPAAVHSLAVQAPCVLRARAPGYLLDTTLTVAAVEGKQEFTVPQLARVELRSKFQDCTVIVGGRALGTPTVDTEFAAGTYTFTIHCPNKTYSTSPIRIGPGRSMWRLDEYLE